MDFLQKISFTFYPGKTVVRAIPFGSGHIHQTFKLEFADRAPIILQKVNTLVFPNPELVVQNILRIARHLKAGNYPYIVLEPIKGKSGYLTNDKTGGIWRAFPFIEDTIAIDKVEEPQQAFETAKAFGSFLKNLSEIDILSIGESIPDFHNLELRFQDFQHLVARNPVNRNHTALAEIESVIQLKNEFQCDFTGLPLRIVHNDTKISNILLDRITGKGVCVIDLDTVMPGWVVTDFGDMIRTICCTADENETNLDRVGIDLEIFQSMVKGFLLVTTGWLQESEIKNLLNGGRYIILEQAIRFLSDYLKGDIYYPVSYPQQNLDRTRNQLKLLQSLIDNEDEMGLIINDLAVI